jgi:sugar lactone lactonase YvrE
MKKQVTFIFFALILIAGSTCKKAVEAPFEAEENVFVQGSAIHGANGIMFDSNDRLHIASFIGREILVMDAETGEIQDRLGIDLGVEGPDDLAFGPDGSLYWTSIETGEVGRLSPDGEKTGQPVAQGVNPITFSDDGRLFVALDIYGDALYELDPELKDPPHLIAENLGWLNGFDFGPDGFLYGPIYTQGKVGRIDVNSDSITIETVSEGFFPAAVKFDSKGRLYAVDHASGEVLRLDTKSGNREVITTLSPGLDNLAFDSRDRLFVSNAQEGSIIQVLFREDDPNKNTRTVSRGGMISPGGVAIIQRPGGERSVFVADIWSLRGFSGQTGKQLSIERHFLGCSEITIPITVSPDGEFLVLSSWASYQVQVWSPEKREVQINLDFSGPPPNAIPLNAIRFKSDLVVADLLTGSVFRVIDGNLNKRETLAEGFKVPVGLAAADGDLWVSDWATGSVWQIVADGLPLSPPKSVATGLQLPEGLAIDLDGSLLVVETGTRRLLRLKPDTAEVSIVAEGLDVGAKAIPDVTPPTWALSSVAVDPSGAIYATGDIGNVLYRFKR